MSVEKILRIENGELETVVATSGFLNMYPLRWFARKMPHTYRDSNMYGDKSYFIIVLADM
jgi:hypothetical protein